MSVTREEGLRTIEELERLYGYKIDAILPDGTHRYYSTHCRHDNHEACLADEVTGVQRGTSAAGRPMPTVAIERKPAQCKTCATPCVCPECRREG